MSYAGRGGIGAAVLVLSGALVENAGIVLLVPLTSIFFGTGPAGRPLPQHVEALLRFVDIHSPVARLAALTGIFGALMIARALIMWKRAVLLAELQVGFVEAQRLRISEHLVTASWDYLAHLQHARIMHLMSGEIQRVGTATNFLLLGFTGCALLVVQCGAALLLAPFMACVTLVLLVLCGVAMVPVLRRARDHGSYVTTANLALLTETTRFLGGLKFAISQELQSTFMSEFRSTLRELTRRQVEYVKKHGATQLAATALEAIFIAVLVFVSLTVLRLAPAVLMAFFVVVTRMSRSAAQVQQSAQQIVNVVPAYEKLDELVRELILHERSGSPREPATVAPEGRITFTDVSYSHPDKDSDGDTGRGVLHLNLIVEPGEFLGIAGPSGSGKTTLADLLVGLHKPQTGTITIGEMELDDRLLPHWRAAVSYVSQDPFLFHDTIRRNLMWASPQATESDLWHVLRLAGADALVGQMQRGLDTIVGERGLLISGGERQRLALARAILRDPKLFVLDEATSAIDVAGEGFILSSLLGLEPRPTIVMVAHRKESLTRCNRVLYLARPGDPPL